MRRGLLRFPLLWVLACSPWVAGCPAAENVLLLEVTSQSDVATLNVAVLDATGRRVGELNVSVNRTREDINGTEPIRLVVPVPGGGPVTVFIRGTAPPSAGDLPLLATRCYVASGAVRDDVLLVQIDDMLDGDADGFPLQGDVTCRDLGDGGSAVVCDVGMCPSVTASDCDDDDPARFPGNDTICMNGIDENCFDEGVLPNGDERCGDNDMDGSRACAEGELPGTCDCADDNPNRHPGIDESDSGMLCNDMVDQDCDGRDTLCDLDGDGYPANVLTGGAPDCDDSNEAINPAATELCDDRIDNNCNRLVDEGAACAPDDLDRDGSDRCPATGTPDCTTCDCNDCNGAIHPGAEEICDGLDQVTGLPVPATGDPFPDCPGDGDGDGQVAPRDCNLADRLAYTGAAENCNTPELEGCVSSGVCGGPDEDADGYVDTQDCNIATFDAAMNAAVNPAAAEACDAIDNDCDGFVNELPGPGTEQGCVFDPVSCASSDTACLISFLANPGDTRHCGGCARDCNSGTTVVANACAAGVCQCTDEPGSAACIEGETCCSGAAPGCADLQTDEGNCGLCGMTCGGAASANPDCLGGSCVCAATGGVCGGGTPNCCGSGCVDLQSDELNCGRCGHECGGGASCSAGVCTCDSPDTADCNGDMSNPGILVADGCEGRLDLPSSCGACGFDCRGPNVSSATCGGSPGARSCNLNCVGGFLDCANGASDGCETPIWGDNSCGTACTGRSNCDDLNRVSDGNCNMGSCEVGTCDAGFLNCGGGHADGCETAIWGDNSCGNACTGRINCDDLTRVADGNCVSGTCDIGSCETGYMDCDGVDSNGCEVHVYANNSCGMGCSGRLDCTTLPFTTGAGTCMTGTCSYACLAGRGDCGGGAGDGCETNLYADASCGSSCGSRMNCDDMPGVTDGNCMTGTCAVGSCDPGRENCNAATNADGCERNVWSDTACGSGCGALTDCDGLPRVLDGNCSSGSCTIGSCDPGGWTNCNGTISDGCEVNLSATTSCGGSCPGVNCTTLPRVSMVGCSAGSCTITSCMSGFANCDGNAGNGCEADPTSATTCGSGCVNCNDLDHVTSGTCSSGSCNITACDAGWDDCNGNDADGCETPLNTVMNCRTCGTTCGGGEMCCPTGSPRCRTSC